MTALLVTVPVFLTLFPTVYCSICLLHTFHYSFYTDLNRMIRENGSPFWYVVGFERPDLPYRTLYHLPENIETNRDCYAYHLTTRLGVIVMDLVCPGKETLDSFDILTRPDGTYVTEKKGRQHELADFRTLNVLRLTEQMVLLVSCSQLMNTYGVLVLHRGPVPAQNEGYLDKMIRAKYPNSLHLQMNYTVPSGSVSRRQCNCSNKITISVRTGDGDLVILQDKRKVFVLITVVAAVVITAIIKFLKRFI